MAPPNSSAMYAVEINRRFKGRRVTYLVGGEIMHCTSGPVVMEEASARGPFVHLEFSDGSCFEFETPRVIGGLTSWGAFEVNARGPLSDEVGFSMGLADEIEDALSRALTTKKPEKERERPVFKLIKK